DALAQDLGRGEERRRAFRLEAEERGEPGVRPVERRVAEAAPVLGGEIDAAELEVARDVLEEVDELQAGAHRVARGHEAGIVEPAQDAEHEAAAGVGGVHAVPLEVVPCLVLGHPLIHPVRLDQAVERLARQVELAHGRLHVPHDGPRRPPREEQLDLSGQVVQGGHPVALVRVAELVDEAGVAVERAHVRAQPAREEDRADREVLARRPGRDLRHFHAASIRGACVVESVAWRTLPGAGSTPSPASTGSTAASSCAWPESSTSTTRTRCATRYSHAPPRTRRSSSSISATCSSWTRPPSACSSRHAAGWRTSRGACLRRPAPRRGGRSRSPGSIDTSTSASPWTTR